MNWSGMGHAEYAAALGFSPHALRIWRDRMDWRSPLHPSARAVLFATNPNALQPRMSYRIVAGCGDEQHGRLTLWVRSTRKKRARDADIPKVEAEMERALPVRFREKVQGMLSAAPARF